MLQDIFKADIITTLMTIIDNPLADTEDQFLRGKVSPVFGWFLANAVPLKRSILEGVRNQIAFGFKERFAAKLRTEEEKVKAIESLAATLANDTTNVTLNVAL